MESQQLHAVTGTSTTLERSPRPDWWRDPDGFLDDLEHRAAAAFKSKLVEVGKKLSKGNRQAQMQSGVNRDAGAAGRLIAVPATNGKIGSPFVRAYPLALAELGVSRRVFLQFLDNLNRVAVGYPPMRAVELASDILSNAPVHEAAIAGTAVNVAAGIAMEGVGEGRMQYLLHHANRDTFKPLGLQAKVVKLSKVAKLAGMPILDEADKVRKSEPLLPPLPDGTGLSATSAQERRMQALEPWISPLELVPETQLDGRMENEPGRFKKLCNTVGESQRRREERKMKEYRKEAYDDWAEDSREAQREYERELQRLVDKEERLRMRRQSPRSAELSRIEEKKERLHQRYAAKVGKLEEARLSQDEEERSFRKTLFLVITKIEASVHGS